MPRPIALLVIAGSCLAASVASRGQEPPPADEGEKAALQAKNLAAFQAFRSLVAAQSYKLSDDELTAMVDAHLRNQAGELPRKPPKPEDLQALLDARFLQAYNTMIGKATQGLDPDGKLGIELRLKDYLQEHGRLRDEAQARYRQYVQKDLPKALKKINSQMVQAQVAKLRQSLIAYLADKRLTAAQIEDAFEHSREGELVIALQRAVLVTCDAQLQRSLLADAYTEFTRYVQTAVSNGTRQLKEQVDAGNGTPQAQTCEGMEKELRQRLRGLVEEQVKKARSDPLWVAYGTFSLAEKNLPEAARRHFDHRVADATRLVSDEFGLGKRAVPNNHSEGIRMQITDNLPEHYDPEISKARLQPWVERVAWADRQWVAEHLAAAVTKATPPFDRGYSPKQFTADVDHALKEGTEAKKAWGGFQALLINIYLEKVTPLVRESLAQDQARHFAPQLADHEWRPSEDEIIGLTDNLDRARLLGLPVWKERPPQEREVLRETWNLWLKSAHAAMELGRQAVVGQEKLVYESEKVITDRIRDSANKDPAHWTDQYVQAVQKAWQAVPGVPAAEYPGLFAVTKRKIADTVARLLSEAAQEQLEGKRRAAQDGRKSPPPATSWLADGDRPKSDALVPGSEKKRTEPIHPIGPSDATKRAAGTEQGKDKGATKTAAVRTAAEYSKILEAQNRIVDQLEPMIREETGKACDEGQPLRLSARTEKYVQETTVQWQQSPLSSMSPNLLPPLVQRIEGLVAETWEGASRHTKGNADQQPKPIGEDRGDSREEGGDEDGFGWDGKGLHIRAYQIGFWTVLFLLFVQSGCWWWNIKYLREYIAARRRGEPAKRLPTTPPRVLSVMGDGRRLT